MNPFNAGRKRGENPTRQAALARARRAGEKMPTLDKTLKYSDALGKLSSELDEIAIRYGWNSGPDYVERLR